LSGTTAITKARAIMSLYEKKSTAGSGNVVQGK
jgi:hypothetical protein